MVKEVFKEFNEKMDKTIHVLQEELMVVRAGRANPAILNNVTVSAYGADTPLNQIAGISAPEPRMIVVQPYDSSLISEIEKAIQIADLGFNPSNDGKIIRLVVPMLTEERRLELTKVVKKIGEDSKIAFRNERHSCLDKLKKLHKDGEITDDDLKRHEKEVQDLIDEHVKKVNDLVAKKEEEIMAV